MFSMRNFQRRRAASVLLARMSKPLFGLALMLALAAISLGASKHEFRAGKLLDVTTDTKLAIRHAVFVVQIDDVIYPTRGDRLERVKASLITMAITKSGDSGQDLIVGDPVEVYLHGDDLIIRKPSGKELKTKVIKRVRAQ